ANADGTYTVSEASPLTVTFTASGAGGEGSGYLYTFNFGDGSYVGPQAGNTASHAYRYANQDGYRVTVTMTDAQATTSAQSGEIVIRTTSQVIVTGDGETVISLDVDPTQGTAPLRVRADATGSTHADGTVRSEYTFDFGDGTAVISNASGTLTHVYTRPEEATYTITVTLVDLDAGGAELGRATATQTVVVNPGNRLTAQMSVNPTTAKTGQLITFDGCHSFAGDGHDIVKFVLDPDDGTPVQEQVVGAGGFSCAPGHNDASVFQHAYAEAGSYMPTLTVYDETGATAKVSASGVMIQAPTAGPGGGSTVGVRSNGGGGALGWLALLPLLGAAARRRRGSGNP
ncbi:MAG TPA: PKD domain-containing protein, partial [Pseudomonadales bacterium]|nr:PKD domain-containing protein [Pseudomonadales bacterium]